ncbi:MAG: hypothetical protein PHE55_08850, partial [Methylococcaceae bacterium]|nr:hypothetical protein [Methylococcaceae bacterium]
MSSKVIEIDHGWKAWVAGMVKAQDGMGIAVGIMGTGADRSDGEMDNATLAAIHEFGKGVVPERSFMRSTFEENKAEIKKREAELGLKVDSTLKGDLMLLGEFHRKNIIDK